MWYRSGFQAGAAGSEGVDEESFRRHQGDGNWQAYSDGLLAGQKERGLLAIGQPLILTLTPAEARSAIEKLTEIEQSIDMTLYVAVTNGRWRFEIRAPGGIHPVADALIAAGVYSAS